MDAKIQNAIIDAIIATMRDRCEKNTNFNPVAEAVAIVHEGTPISSPARRLVVKVWSDCALSSWITEWKDPRLPREFLEEVTLGLLEDRQRTAKGIPKEGKGQLDPEKYYTSDCNTATRSERSSESNA